MERKRENDRVWPRRLRDQLGSKLGAAEVARRAVAATQHLSEGDVEEAQPLLRDMVTAGIAVGGMELLRE